MNHPKVLSARAGNARGSQSSIDCPDLYLEAEANQFYRPKGNGSKLIADPGGQAFMRLVLWAIGAWAVVGLYFYLRK